MVALVSLPYPIANFITHRAVIRPRTSTIRCSVRATASPSRRIRRKNYLRLKILKTLSKPYPDFTPEDTGVRVEPIVAIVEVPLEPELETSSESVVGEELETSVSGDVGGLEELEVVRDVKGADVVGFKGVSGHTVFRIIASFVGLFVLQAVVSVWVLGSGDPDENDRSSNVDGRYAKKVGLNGSVVVGDPGSSIVDEDKVNEIRRMARAVREAEKRKKKLENGEMDLDDVSDDEEDLGIDTSVKSGIANEIDGQLTTLRKRSSAPLLNVDFLKRKGDPGKEAKYGGVIGKDEDDMMIFEAKRKFRSQLTTPGDKPKGFQSVSKTSDNIMNDAKNNMSNTGMGKGESASHHSTPLQVSLKSSAGNKAGRSSEQGINSSTISRSVHNLSNEKSEGPPPKKGVVQDHDNGNPLNEGAKLKESSIIASQDLVKNMNDQKAPTSSKILTMQRKKGQPDLENPITGVSGGSDKDKKHNVNQDLWWSSLPFVFVILMQKGHGNGAQEGFFTIHVKSDSYYASSYTVAFEDQNDARNFSFILESTFEDLPDAAVDIVLLPTKELKEITESLDKGVIVARKGELKIYAGQPLLDAESALKQLLK